MSEELCRKVVLYRIAISAFSQMLLEGIITEEEYAEIDTMIAKKYGLDSGTIFR